MKPTLLVLAAGMGSRYGGLKQIDGLGPNKETIIDYSIYDAVRAGFGKVVMIIRKSMENDIKNIFFKKYEDKIAMEAVYQELEYVPEGVSYNPERVKPWGTAHAVLMAKDAIKEPFCVINGDDFYGADAFQTVAKYLNTVSVDSPDYCMVGYQLSKTLSDNGTVSRGICKSNADAYLDEVVECSQISRQDDGIIHFTDDKGVEGKAADNTLVSMNFWGFTPAYFNQLVPAFDNFIRTRGQELKSELYIPTTLTTLIKANEARVKVLRSEAEWFGVTYQADRQMVVDKLAALVKQGVYPTPLW